MHPVFAGCATNIVLSKMIILIEVKIYLPLFFIYNIFSFFNYSI